MPKELIAKKKKKKKKKPQTVLISKIFLQKFKLISVLCGTSCTCHHHCLAHFNYKFKVDAY